MADKKPKYLPGWARLFLRVAAWFIQTMVGVFIYTKIFPNKLVPDLELKYSDLITIILASVAIMAALFGLFIGALAIWGYTQLSKLAVDAAKDYVKYDIRKGDTKKLIASLVTAHLSNDAEEGGIYRKILEEAADRYALSGANKVSETGVSSEDEDEGDA